MNDRTSSTAPDSRTTRIVIITLALWFALATGAGLSGLLRDASASVIGATNWLLVIAVLAACWYSPSLRKWVRAIDMKKLVLLHTIRIVGGGLLMLNAEGHLPHVFVVSGGHNGIAVALMALVVAFVAVPVRTSTQWWIMLAWNLVGLAGILRVLVTGIQLGMADMSQMAAMTEWPLNLLPTFLTPLMIATHVMMLDRLWRRRTVLHMEAAIIA